METKKYKAKWDKKNRKKNKLYKRDYREGQRRRAGLTCTHKVKCPISGCLDRVKHIYVWDGLLMCWLCYLTATNPIFYEINSNISRVPDSMIKTMPWNKRRQCGERLSNE